jgi:hypothetical protein
MLQYDVAKVSSQGTSCAVAGTRGGGGKLIWNFLKSSARSSGMKAPLEEPLDEELLAESFFVFAILRARLTDARCTLHARLRI